VNLYLNLTVQDGTLLCSGDPKTLDFSVLDKSNHSENVAQEQNSNIFVITEDF
jgi:hypothetical protein